VIWETVLAEAKAQDVECGPIGLAARDSLRFESGFALYGHELSEEISPIQARLKWACNLEKQFIGAETIRRQAEHGVATTLATVQLTDRGVPRQGHAVIHDGTKVGYVASGMYAPTVDAYCANVFVASDLAKIGTELEIEIRGKRKRTLVVKRPLYKPAYR
jgi:glycine cleavage system aminomethyltransferase T